jgi:hypothetical protein
VADSAGRKNWLFSWHPRSAEAGAFLYSLIETAKATGLKRYAHLRYLFDQLPLAKTEEDYRNLLPPNLDASRRNSAAAQVQINYHLLSDHTTPN